MRWFSRLYGSNPLHLLVTVACFAIAGYAANKLRTGDVVGILVWLGGAVVGHDLILFPLYAVADRSVITVFRRRPPALPAVPWINYLRVPVVLSAILLLIWWPLIFRLPKQFTTDHTGLSLNPYLGRWLAVTGTLFLLSALAFALRLGPGRRPRSTLGRREADPYPQRAALRSDLFQREGIGQDPGAWGEPPWPVREHPGARGAPRGGPPWAAGAGDPGTREHPGARGAPHGGPPWAVREHPAAWGEPDAEPPWAAQPRDPGIREHPGAWGGAPHDGPPWPAQPFPPRDTRSREEPGAWGGAPDDGPPWPAPPFPPRDPRLAGRPRYER